MAVHPEAVFTTEKRMIRTSCIPGDSHRVGVVPGLVAALVVALGLALWAGTPAVALAQPVFQPGKSIRLLVGFPPGGSTDLLARNLANKLADQLGVPFMELNREVERMAGCDLDEIHNLLGVAAYRRYERRALEATLQDHPRLVLAAPGGIVSDPASFNLLLSHCFTIWIKASPQEHMQRVMAQGDLRPMAGNREAMDDLRRILEGRAALYARADLQIDTSGRTLDEAFRMLREGLRDAIGPDDDA
jgi:shikimate kinase